MKKLSNIEAKLKNSVSQKNGCKLTWFSNWETAKLKSNKFSKFYVFLDKVYDKIFTTKK